MQEYVQSIAGGKSLQEVESVDASGNVIHKRVIQQRLYPDENWVLVFCKNKRYLLTPLTQTLTPNLTKPTTIVKGHHVIQSNNKVHLKTGSWGHSHCKKTNNFYFANLF